MDLFPVHATPNADLPAVVPAFGDPSLGFGDAPQPVSANARFSGVLPTSSTSSFVPVVGFGHLTSSFDGLTLKFGGLSKAADKTHAAFLRNTEVYRLERRRGAYEIIGAAAALGSIVERTAIAPALEVESAIHSAADSQAGGTGHEGQHAHSLFASAGLVRAEDVGQMNGHEAYYQSHSVLGHEFVDKTHVILGNTHDAPVHASSEVFSHPTSDADHGTHGAASHETALHTVAGHHASEQLHGGSNEHTAAANHGVGAHAAHRDPMADGNHHGQAGGDQSQTHEGGSKHELLTTHEIADLDHAKEDGYHTEQAVKENVEVSKIDIEGTEALGAEKATERAERPERQAVRENVMRALVARANKPATSQASTGYANSNLAAALAARYHSLNRA